MLMCLSLLGEIVQRCGSYGNVSPQLRRRRELAETAPRVRRRQPAGAAKPPSVLLFDRVEQQTAASTPQGPWRLGIPQGLQAAAALRARIMDREIDHDPLPRSVLEFRL